MKNKITNLFISLLITTIAYSQESKPNFHPTEISIRDAINKGILELKICGAYDPRYFYEVLDRDGVHYGKCMAIVLKSKIDSFVIVKLDCGTLLVPTDSMVQTMLVTHKAAFPLYPRQIYATRFYAMCAQLHNRAPGIETTFRIGEIADSNLLKIANYLDVNYVQNMLGQHAVWAFTDQADFEVLKHYGADSASINKTKEILTALNIKTRLMGDKKFKTISNEISVNRYVIFSCLALLIIFAITTIGLFYKQRRDINNIDS